MATKEQDEIQIQCQKDWAILQIIHEDKKEGTFVYACPVCSMRYFLVPIELDSSPEGHSEISHTPTQDHSLKLPLEASQANPEAVATKPKKSRTRSRS